MRTMEYFLFICLFLLATFHNASVYSKQFAASSHKRCMPDFYVSWSHELSSSPFAGSPVITDINADGEIDIVVGSFSGDIHVVAGSTGQPLPNTYWPVRLPHSTFHASPLQHDFDADGLLDILMCTSQGEIYVLTYDGQIMTDRYFKLEGVAVAKDWHKKRLSADKGSIHSFILDNLFEKDLEGHVVVDSHVLATPVLIDLNQDGKTEELIIPVSYYYDLEHYSNPEFFDELSDKLSYQDLENYLVSSIVIVNVTSLQVIRTIHLELTKVEAEYPGYVLFSPTVIDLDSDGGPLDIIVGTSAGNLHVFSASGELRTNFPIPADTIHGQVAVEDVNLDGLLEMVVTDVSGNVNCYSRDGAVVWEAMTSGTRPSGVRIADVNHDGSLEVILAADDGEIWVLSGQTGEVLPGWPFTTRQKLRSPPLVTRIEGLGPPAVVVLGSEGQLYLLGGKGKCRHAVNLGESSFLSVLSQDLIPESPGLELLVATQDGTLGCVAQGNITGMIPDETFGPAETKAFAWPSETKGGNEFTYGTFYIDATVVDADGLPAVSSSSFYVALTIADFVGALSADPFYKVQVNMGSKLLLAHEFSEPGTYILEVDTPRRPQWGHLVVQCTNHHGKVSRDIIPIRFNMLWLSDVQWVLVAPSAAMAVVLLFLYGFPDTQHLPVIFPNKER